MVASLDRLMSFDFPEVRTRYTERDIMLYALGLGLPTDPLDPEALRFVYEKALKPLPTYAAVAGHPGLWVRDSGLDFTRIVHGEQTLRLHRPLPAAADIVARSRVTGVSDKGEGKGVVVYYERELHLADGSPLATIGQSLFARGDGGIGSAGTGVPVPAQTPPDRPADHVASLAVSERAAAIYRLSGDYNPLHIDPEVAAKAGFPRPILHGLATYGAAGYAVIMGAASGDPARLRGLDCRFQAPVFPGETIETSVWSSGEQAVFQTRVVERDKVVLSGVAQILAA